MPVSTVRTPAYRLHKPSGQAVVTLSGRDFYLGSHGTPSSRSEYDRLVAEWLSNNRRCPSKARESVTDSNNPSIAEVILGYVNFAESYYTKNGAPTSEVRNIKLALRSLRELYGLKAARDFGPLALKAVRQTLIDSKICRNEVNKRVRHIVRVFRWAVENELVPPAVHQALKAVRGLSRGRTEARESTPVKPVPNASVDAIRPYLARQVWAMIELQRLTGMRPGEVCQMRSCDVDMNALTWTYTPDSHKTEHHGKVRKIYFGPRAREILRPWLRPNPTEYLFSPAEAVAERRAKMRESRKTPVQPSQRDRSKKRPIRKPGDRYDVPAYNRAIDYACKKAGLPKWHPHQLRHNAATSLRKEFGLETARAVLGHSSTSVTEIYAEIDQDKAVEAMERVG